MELYAWKTPNGYKPLIMLEELKVDYDLKRVNIGEGEQHRADFLKINPNGKIPVLVDQLKGSGQAVTVCESGAILIYLAEKYGALLPAEGVARYQTFQWLMFQMAGLGPIMGQAVHFRSSGNEKESYSISRFTRESARLLEVLQKRLRESEYLAGEYSIADIATYPWVKRIPPRLDIALDDMPEISRWIHDIDARPAIQRAYAIEF